MTEKINPATLTYAEQRANITNLSRRLSDADRTYTRTVNLYEVGGVSAAEQSDKMFEAYKEINLPDVIRVEDEMLAEADEAHEFARQVFKATKSAPLTLNDSEWQAAEYRRETIREDVERLRIPDLLDRVRSAVNKADRAAMFHFHRYVPGRLSAAQRADGVNHEDERRELSSLLNVIAEQLRDPEIAEMNDRVRELLHQASDLRSKATKRRRDEPHKPLQHGTMIEPVFGFQKQGDIAWMKK